MRRFKNNCLLETYDVILKEKKRGVSFLNEGLDSFICNNNFNKFKFAVLLIDMQKCFLDKLYSHDVNSIVLSQRDMISHCKKYGVPFFNIEYKSCGKTIFGVRKFAKEIENYKTIVKKEDDAFCNTKLDFYLKKFNVNSVFLMGVNMSACVLRTARSALNNGYRIAISSDVVADERNNYFMQEGSLSFYKQNGIFTDDLSFVKKFVKY
jgi:isochorismate hydrolase